MSATPAPLSPTGSGTTLLIIDAQRDFHPGGSLAIPTANDDAARIAKILSDHGSSISRVVATLDSHHKLHIAHPGFWIETASGNKPSPFTIISSQDIVDGKFKPRDGLRFPKDSLDMSVFGGDTNAADLYNSEDGTLDALKYAIEYTKRLEAKGRFQLCIWPEHCLIGSPGHSIVDDIREAIGTWCETTGGSVEWVHKGQNLLTEMYSALAADVPVSTDTDFNETLQQSLMDGSNKVVVCGQAMSHCVNYTTRDIVDRWPKERISEICVLTDCASAVPGFEAAADTFLKDMKEVGVTITTSNEMFP